uniref:CASP-like protein n=1 Tax=Ananas comosus var. bracteatus TaxID=296719 RepID=A0A6V7QDA6_ANACO|nr:unnamed protein product [Ananas comosus var. bracteatus]
MKEEANEPFKFVEMALRICVVPLTVASILVMATNKQESDTYGKVEYNNLTGFKYLVCISAISAGYALASTLSSFLRFFWSAVAEVVYLAEEGDREASWSEVCSYYGKFCYKTKVSLALHFMALVGFIALSLISAYRLFSKFDAPAVASTEVGEEGK